MAAKTFQENTATSGKYLWSTDANWGGTKPVAGDTVTIPAGLTCTLDVDIALGTGSGTAMTVNGTLDLPSTSAAGTYGFTLTGNVAGTGTISAGTSGTALPNNVIYDIEFSGAFGFTGVLNFQLYCTHPTNKIIYLSGAEAAGQTELSVDTDVTGDIWAVGDLIRIDDITTNADSEIRTIAAGGIAAGAITVTSGLTGAKTSGSYVIRVTRNIMIRGGTAHVIQVFADGSYIRAAIIPSASNYNGISYQSTNSITFDGVISGGGRSLYSVQAVTMSGILTGAAYSAFYVARNITVTADGVISGTEGFRACSNIVFSGTMSGATYLCSTCQNIIFDGNITYCSTAFASSSNIVLAGGSITNCTSGLYQCSNICGNGTTLNNTYDLQRTDDVRLFDCTLSGTIENYEYDTAYMLGNEFVESFDHDGVADAYKAWTKGGIVTSLTDAPLPTGFSMYYGHAGDDSGAINFRQKEIDVEPGKTITVSGYIKIDDATDHTARPPRIEIIDAYADPLVDAANDALAYDEVADPDGSDSSWQAVSCSWTNTDGIARHVFVRMSCKMASTKVVKENFMIEELEDPNYPAEADVFYGTGAYGVGDAYTPAMRASDIANCEAGNIKKNVVIDDVTGTYDPVAAAVWPAAANVSTVETAWGPNGNDYAGSLNLALYVLIANVVDAAYVVTGNNNYVGGSAGTYPTTATSKAEQLAEDVAAVNAAKASIKDDTTILTVTGTYDFTTALAASYADGQAAQLVTDKAAVTAAAGSIKDDATILTIAGTYDFTAAIAAGYADGEAAQLATDAAAVLAVAEYITTDVTDLLGVAGTLNMSLYTLTSGIVFPDAAETWHTAGSYGPTGVEYTAAMYASDIPVTNGIGEYLSAGDIVLGVVVDDLTGTASGGGGGDPPAVPAISLAGGADSITVTLDGDAGVTNYVVYKTSGAAAWTSGGSRSGDGDVVISGLTAGTTYLVSAYSDNGEYSTFAPVQVVTLTASTSDDPTGSLSVPLGLLADTLAASAAFRAWVGATTGTEEENLTAALARIYEYESESWTRPYGLVSHDDLWHAGKIADGSHNLFSHDGELFLGFEADAEETGDAELSARRFSNTVGTILDEMKALAGTPGYLNIVDIQKKTGPQRCRPDRRDEADAAEDYWLIECKVRWSD